MLTENNVKYTLQLKPSFDQNIIGDGGGDQAMIT
jgi:hypothetical protein